MRALEAAALETEGVKHTVSVSGQSVMIGTNAPNFATLYVMLKDFPFDRYPQTFVSLKYEDPATGWTHEDSALLDQQHPSLALAFRTSRDAAPEVEYRYTFLSSDAERLETASLLGRPDSERT